MKSLYKQSPFTSTNLALRQLVIALASLYAIIGGSHLWSKGVGLYTIECLYDGLARAQMYVPRPCRIIYDHKPIWPAWSFNKCVGASNYRGVLFRDRTVYLL